MIRRGRLFCEIALFRQVYRAVGIINLASRFGAQMILTWKVHDWSFSHRARELHSTSESEATLTEPPISDRPAIYYEAAQLLLLAQPALPFFAVHTRCLATVTQLLSAMQTTDSIQPCLIFRHAAAHIPDWAQVERHYSLEASSMLPRAPLRSHRCPPATWEDARRARGDAVRMTATSKLKAARPTLTTCRTLPCASS